MPAESDGSGDIGEWTMLFRVGAGWRPDSSDVLRLLGAPTNAAFFDASPRLAPAHAGLCGRHPDVDAHGLDGGPDVGGPVQTGACVLGEERCIEGVTLALRGGDVGARRVHVPENRCVRQWSSARSGAVRRSPSRAEHREPPPLPGGAPSRRHQTSSAGRAWRATTAFLSTAHARPRGRRAGRALRRCLRRHDRGTAASCPHGGT